MAKENKLFKLFKGKFWEPIAVGFTGLLMVAVSAQHAVSYFNTDIHNVFGTSDFKEVKDPNATTIERPALKNADNIETYYRDVNQTVEAEGLVLLKNENHALPLENSSSSKVTFALGGAGKIFYATHGPGVRRDGEANGDYFDFRKALKAQTSLNVNDATFEFLSEGGAGAYHQGLVAGTHNVKEVGWSTYSSVVNEYTDSTVLAVITRESGEGSDVAYKGSDGTDGSYLSLTNQELEILENLANLKRDGKVKKIVVLLNSAMNVQCDFIDNEKYGIDAAMWIGLPGATGMKAVADALVGKVNPSGGLSDIFLKDNFSSPAAQYWKINNGFSKEYTNAKDYNLDATQKYYGVYVEGVYVGYRYFETRYEDVVLGTPGTGEFSYDKVVAYPFGHGLSYTTFSEEIVSLEPVLDSTGKVKNYELKVKVTNTGSVAGKHIVQAYLQKPYGAHAKIVGMEKPAVELAGFEKTKLLNANESETLTISVDFSQLRSYDAEADKTYVLDQGDYYLAVGDNSHSAINNILLAKGRNLPAGQVGEQNLARKILTQESVDSTVFSTSTAVRTDFTTKQEPEVITNQLDWMDPNRFKGVKNDKSEDGDVTYVSRRNWAATMPKEETNLSLTGITAKKYDVFAHKPIVDDPADTMPVFGDTTQKMTLAMMLGLKYDDPKWEIILNNLTQEEIFTELTNCYGYTLALQTIAKPATDEDDGPYGVSNCKEGYSSMSCEGIIAASFNKEVFAKVGEAIAADARSNFNPAQKNLHGLYAPGLNIHRVAFGGRAAEYFSEDPYLSGIAAQYEIIEMQKQYVVACPKHYIFNDEEINRNGISIWMNEQAAREIYLEPWEYAVRPDRGNAHSLMTSFNRAGYLWTSASDNLMENILRGEWAFDGYTLTDMAGSNGSLYMVFDDGFMNGTDCFLDKGKYDGGMTQEMRKSTALNLKLREAMHRLLYTIVNYSAAMNGYSASTILVPVVVPWKVALNLLTIFSAIFAACGFAIVVFGAVLRTKDESK